MGVKKYQQKPTVVEAIQFDGENLEEIQRFAGRAFKGHIKGYRSKPTQVFIFTGERNSSLEEGGFLVKNPEGHLEVHSKEIFMQRHTEFKLGEKVEEKSLNEAEKKKAPAKKKGGKRAPKK